MRYATFGYAQIESILATVLRTYLRSARMKGSLVANARKTLRWWLMQGTESPELLFMTGMSVFALDICIKLCYSYS